MSKNNRRYTAEERRAYWMGQGARIGFGRTDEIKRTTKGMSAAEKKSFYNGFDGIGRGRNAEKRRDK